MDRRDEEKGQKLLTAVERIVASNEKLRSLAQRCAARAKKPGREGAALEVVRHFSNRAMLVGGAAAVPSLVPGPHSLLVGVGGVLAELTMLLKYEVELALTLSHLYGFDIEDPVERQIAFLLASVGTYDARSGKNFLLDVAKVEGQAVWNYAPRKVGKVLVQAMASLALLYLWRGFARFLPVVGIIVGTSMNKVLTQKVGRRCVKDLEGRRSLLERQAAKKPRVAAARRPRRATRRAAQ
ncbi:MAG: EcsC family protein [Myxococcales bacterium]|nr:EcsC family protein [Myxococcales bacterium]